MNSDYYVYIYWRLDTNEVFYVGKGHGDRWKRLDKRNKHFKNIINKYPTMCEIVKENLTENKAFYWEEEIIRILVFEYGYSIDISNNRSREKGYHLANMTWGGDGTSGMNPWDMVNENRREEWKIKISEATKGKNHPMYGKHHSEETKEKMKKNHWSKNSGINPFKGKHHSEETKKKLSEINKELYKNKENHPRYGKQHSEETKEKIGEKAKERFKDKNNHPMYGKHLSEETRKKISESHKGKYSGRNSSNTKSVICLTTKKIFYMIKEAMDYYKCCHIAECCKGKRKSAGKLSDGTPLKWRYITWNHNKKYRIKK